MVADKLERPSPTCPAAKCFAHVKKHEAGIITHTRSWCLPCSQWCADKEQYPRSVQVSILAEGHLSRASCSPPALFYRFSRVPQQVKLGGNKASGAKRMYFVLVHAIGSQQGRISAPPRLEKSPLTPPSPASTELVAAGSSGGPHADPFGEGNGGGGGSGGGGRGRDELRKSSKRKEGVVVESKDDQVFRFWDDGASGKLVQAPLDLDRQGRGWCQVRRSGVSCACRACVCFAFSRPAAWEIRCLDFLLSWRSG